MQEHMCQNITRIRNETEGRNNPGSKHIPATVNFKFLFEEMEILLFK